MLKAVNSRVRLAPVRRQTFRAQIVDELRSSIINGELAPGSQIIETDLAAHFGVSRGPLREALRQLIEDGLLVTVPYTGTHVADLSTDDILEVFSLRMELEVFAFREVWLKRDEGFRAEISNRHERLVSAIRRGNGAACITAELALHSFVYEACGHKILLGFWESLRGKLQLYWAAHYRIQGRKTPDPGSHARYVELATGNDLDAMIKEIHDHMLLGFGDIKQFVQHYQNSRMLGA